MSRYVALVAGVCLLVLSTAAWAYQFRTFHKADSGAQATFDSTYMMDMDNGYAVSWGDNYASATIYQTTDGGATWSAITTLDTALSSGATGAFAVLRPTGFVLGNYYWDASAYQMNGRAFVSWDNGATWSEITQSVTSTLGSSEVGIWGGGVSDSGIWLRATGRSVGTFMLFSADQGASWTSYAAPLNYFHFAVSRNNSVVGYGTDSSGVHRIARFDQESGSFQVLSGGDLDKVDATSVDCNWSGNVFTVVDYRSTNNTSQRMAMVSSDGGATWSTLFDSDLNSGDHPGYDFFNALAIDGQTAYATWHQWSVDSQGNVSNTGFAIKKTSDGGATWTTIVEGSTDGHYFIPQQPSEDGKAYVLEIWPAERLLSIGGYFDLP